jgi:hypothetical protein
LSEANIFRCNSITKTEIPVCTPLLRVVTGLVSFHHLKADVCALKAYARRAQPKRALTVVRDREEEEKRSEVGMEMKSGDTSLLACR